MSLWSGCAVRARRVRRCYELTLQGDDLTSWWRRFPLAPTDVLLVLSDFEMSMHIRADASSTPKPLDGVMGQPREFKTQVPSRAALYEPRTRPRHPWHASEPAGLPSRRAEPAKTACTAA